MTREMDFRKPKLREYITPSSLCLCQYPPERTVHATGYDITNVLFLLSKYDGNYNW